MEKLVIEIINKDGECAQYSNPLKGYTKDLVGNFIYHLIDNEFLKPDEPFQLLYHYEDGER